MLLSNALLIALAGLVASTPTPGLLGLFSKQTVSCLQVGASATARWTNSAGKQCTYTGIVGSNYEANPSGSGEYVDLKRSDRSIASADLYKATPVMDVAELVASESHWATPTLKIAFRMIFVLTLRARVVAQGMSSFLVFNDTGANDLSDPNCGAAYNAAIDDTTFGVANGCGKSNPSNPVSKPSGQPTCK
jgi:hypothetical protein